MSVFNPRRLSVFDSAYGVARQCWSGGGVPMEYGAACNAFIICNRPILKNMMRQNKIMKSSAPTQFSGYKKNLGKEMCCRLCYRIKVWGKPALGLVCEYGYTFVEIRWN